MKQDYRPDMSIIRESRARADADARRHEAATIARDDRFWVHFHGHPMNVARWAESARASWAPPIPETSP